MLWRAVRGLRERLSGVRAVEVERVGFVVGWWGKLREKNLVGRIGEEGDVRVGGPGTKTEDLAADVEESAVQDRAGRDGHGVGVVASGALPPAAEEGKEKGKGDGKSKRKRGESTSAAPGSGIRKSSRNK